MLIDVSEVLLNIGAVASFRFSLPPIVDADVTCVTNVEGEVTFTNAGDTLILRGAATTAIEVPCARCCHWFQFPIAVNLEEEIEIERVPAGKRGRRPEVNLLEDGAEIAGKLFSGHNFDLVEALRQYIILETPSRPEPARITVDRCGGCGKLDAEILDGRLARARANPASPFAALEALRCRIEDEPSAAHSDSG
ncbi:MAG: DUF177 domain-containing protein [Armatimonadetes bacterium]|nr:DUF177 domain-containing protein [Armatimonadota bacterium]MDE2205081.1 DUF177 domain-containing protein [Armatimonadota bacterium]